MIQLSQFVPIFNFKLPLRTPEIYFYKYAGTEYFHSLSNNDFAVPAHSNSLIDLLSMHRTSTHSYICPACQ